MRDKHTFQFSARRIADAAAEEATYHAERIEHWKERLEQAVNVVKSTIGAKLVMQPVSLGQRYSVIVDHGDPQAWQELQLAESKIEYHRQALEQFKVEERVYGSQRDRVYELDTVDVAHFRLGGEQRND